jgi:sugar lactone lactonase YvrE
VAPAATGDITTYAGGGAADGRPATEANINVPVTMLQAGTDLYIADSTNQRVRKVNLAQTPPTITSVAGRGLTGTSPVGTLAVNASFYYPSGVARDASGTIYFSDSYNNRILRILPDPDDGGALKIRLVAGYGPCCLPGDGGQAAGAYLNAPRQIAIDSARNLLYIADTGNSRVRRVDLGAGTITTVAGNGVVAYAGDGGPAALASLANPWGVALNPSGTALYIADSSNHVIRKVDLVPESLTHGFISTVAGTGTPGYLGDGGPATAARLFQPYGVAADGFGALFIADSGNNRVRKVAASGTISTVAGTGIPGFSGEDPPLAAASAQVAQPFGVALDPSGRLLIADTMNHRIRRVDLSQSPPMITTIAGSGTCCVSGDGLAATVGDLHEPRGMAADVDSQGALRALYIAGEAANAVRKIDASGIASAAAGGGNICKPSQPLDGSPAPLANLCSPHDVAVQVDSQTGNLIALYIADTGRNTIRKVDLQAPGTRISTVAGGWGLPEPPPPNPDHFVEAEDCGLATSAHLSGPEGVAVDSTRGILYIADSGHDRIRRVNLATGIIGTVGLNSCGIPPTGGGPGAPAPMSSSSSGGIPVPVPDLGDGTLLEDPGDVEVDSSRNLLYIADTWNNAIWRLEPDTGLGSALINPGSPAFSGDGGKAWEARVARPQGVALDPSKNRLYIADTYNHRIRKVNVEVGTDAYGDISTVAGDGAAAFTGDGGLAISASLSIPEGVAASATALFVGDTYNHRVRKVNGLP